MQPLSSLQVLVHGGVHKNRIALYPAPKGQDSGNTTLGSGKSPRLFPPTPINEDNYLHDRRLVGIQVALGAHLTEPSPVPLVRDIS